MRQAVAAEVEEKELGGGILQVVVVPVQSGELLEVGGHGLWLEPEAERERAELREEFLPAQFLHSQGEPTDDRPRPLRFCARARPGVDLIQEVEPALFGEVVRELVLDRPAEKLLLIEKVPGPAGAVRRVVQAIRVHPAAEAHVLRVRGQVGAGETPDMTLLLVDGQVLNKKCLRGGVPEIVDEDLELEDTLERELSALNDYLVLVDGKA